MMENISNNELLSFLMSWLRYVPESEKDAASYIEYTYEVDKVFHQLEHLLQHKTSEMQLALDVMKLICEFYSGDWCGVLDVDEDVGTWSPYWWYDASVDGMGESPYQQYEPTSLYPGWLKALHENYPVVILNTEDTKETHPEEYAEYKKQKLSSVIGAPYNRGLSSFLIVKNPKRFAKRTILLQTMAYLVVKEADDYKEQEAAGNLLSPELLPQHIDVSIDLLGGLHIKAERGELTDSDLKAPKMSRILVFLILNRHRGVSPREIANKIWPDEAPDSPGDNVKYLVHRFKQLFKQISDDVLIVSTDSGYRLNPNLVIVTDIEKFDQLWQNAYKLRDERMKRQFLKQAMMVYKGNMLPKAISEHWLLPYATRYNQKYLSIANKLFGLLAKDNDFETIHDLAAEVLKIERGNADIYYWFIYSLWKTGASVMAKKEVAAAKEALIYNDYMQLISKLQALESLEEDSSEDNPIMA